VAADTSIKAAAERRSSFLIARVRWSLEPNFDHAIAEPARGVLETVISRCRVQADSQAQQQVCVGVDLAARSRARTDSARNPAKSDIAAIEAGLRPRRCCTS